MDGPGESPSVVTASAPFVSLATGSEATCGVTSAGEVVCWGVCVLAGIDSAAQGTPQGTMCGWMDEPSEVPHVVPLGPAAVVKVRVSRSVWSAGATVCALTEQEQLLCWGVYGGLPYPGVQYVAAGLEPSADVPALAFPPAPFGNVMGAPGSYCTVDAQCLSGSCLAETCVGP